MILTKQQENRIFNQTLYLDSVVGTIDDITNERSKHDPGRHLDRISNAMVHIRALAKGIRDDLDTINQQDGRERRKYDES